MLRDFFKNEQDESIDDLITDVVTEMKDTGPNEPEYNALMDKLKQLREVKAETGRKPLSRDTIAMVAANLIGILIIVAYEQKHVLSTKSLTQLVRPLK